MDNLTIVFEIRQQGVFMKRLLLPALVFAVLALPVSAGAKTYDKDYIGKIKVYRAAFEDTFVHLARDNDLGFVEMRAANPNVDPWIPGAGTKIILPKQHLLPDAPREGIVINLPEMRLYFSERGYGAQNLFHRDRAGGTEDTCRQHKNSLEKSWPDLESYAAHAQGRPFPSGYGSGRA